MLRASSLGLNFPPPTIFAVRTCRRICGVGIGWGTQIRFVTRKSNNRDDGDSHDSAPVNSSSNATITQHPQTYPHNPRYQRVLLHYNIQLQGELQEEQQIVVGDPRLQRQGAPHLQPQNHALRALSSSMTFQDTDASKQMEETATTGIQMTEVDLDRTTDQNASVVQQQNIALPSFPSEGIDVIRQVPRYAAGRPWSMEKVKPVNIPSHILKRLESMQRAIAVARRQYYFASKKRNGTRVTKVVELPKKSWSRLDTQKMNLRISRSQNIVKVKLSVKLEGVRSHSGVLLQQPPSRDVPSLIRVHLDILGTTNSTDQAWHSYVYLVDTIASHPVIHHRIKHISHSHLHRFARLLAHNRPRTHLQYLRLLSVMTYIVHCGGQLKLPEWNALIHHSAAVRRKTTTDDVDRAINVYRGMRRAKLPFTSAFDAPDTQNLPPQTRYDADIFTMTTLLSLAARAKDETLLYRLSTDFEKSGIRPNRFALLMMFRHFGEKKDLAGVRHTMRKMKKQGFELGLDGLNAVLWAYGINGRLDIVMMIYRVLRHNKEPETHVGPDDIHSVKSKLKEEHILVGDQMIPNEITYTAIIQLLSFNGNFQHAINVFIDMLSTDNIEQGAPLFPSDSGELVPGPYTPSLVIYRALFIGFQRHGIPPSRTQEGSPSTWTLKNLFGLFDRFLTLPADTVLSHALLDILMAAFALTSGRDIEIMRKVWKAIDDRFGIVFPKLDGKSRLRRLQQMLFPENSEPR